MTRTLRNYYFTKWRPLVITSIIHAFITQQMCLSWQWQRQMSSNFWIMRGKDSFRMFAQPSCDKPNATVRQTTRVPPPLETECKVKPPADNSRASVSWQRETEERNSHMNKPATHQQTLAKSNAANSHTCGIPKYIITFWCITTQGKKQHVYNKLLPTPLALENSTPHSSTTCINKYLLVTWLPGR